MILRDLTGVLLWEGIIINQNINLHVFDTSSVTAQRYRDEVCESYVMLFGGGVGDDFIFMNDNATSHKVQLVEDFLYAYYSKRPARSPDLKPTQHVWDAQGRTIARRQPYDRTFSDLKSSLLEEMDLLPQALINKFILV
ncbi:hypothetical protein AVEN_206644-1 [Araneus ventricosus]|uniref:Tc1-like transposase DDE domain-containing protein n=1 Tax=Araneus ventricosus TaxID=182803 RepID=A0A4Y2H428_ARAVE|nr:hypothetical protein AVEN_206644-1 [Araneus ventricosus]